MSKKRAFRPNIGGTLRPHAEAPRRDFFYIHVTQQEHGQIQQYCREKQISVSQFIAELVLTDAEKPKRHDKVLVRAELELTQEEVEKLELLTKFHQQDSPGQYLYELLKPHLELQRLHSPIQRKPLRYYLSEKEHGMVSKYLEAKGMSARYYPVMLALKAIAKQRDK